jgi:hypothetical protein
MNKEILNEWFPNFLDSVTYTDKEIVDFIKRAEDINKQAYIDDKIRCDCYVRGAKMIYNMMSRKVD